ncbi:protein SDE2 homolog [Fopius arisanus]|uniref:Protein SDE2 homolog n=1 Tax=Fopius arisanus TaxID=64838 RepID=A0A0C9Q7U0_9HYME|nr:PREDICTED: protein SDE2 homolog [Fopius arisanus]
MIEIKLEVAHNCESVLTLEKSDSVDELWRHLEKKGFFQRNFYILQNGRLLSPGAHLSGDVRVIPKLLGGKGGFGSMLRAIGAQIEKTTNREACRDLSGRRLRDINEEKRLKAWIENQGNRKEEQAERKKKKLERLCAEPKHEFKDKNYEHERSILTERIDDAVEQGFKTAATTSSLEPPRKSVKRKTMLDEFDDIDSEELSSSEEESDQPVKKIIKGEKTSGDSGCSSSVDDHSESSCDKKEEGKIEETPEYTSILISERKKIEQSN